MTIDHWLRIAQILTTLIAPILAGYMLSRINNPKFSPATNQPKPRVHTIRDWLKVLPKWFWAFNLLLIALNIYSTIRTLRDPAPLNRSEVYAIALGMVATGFQFAVLFLMFMLGYLITGINRIVDEIVTLNKEAVEETRQWMIDITEALKTIPPDKPTSRFDRIIENLKKLLS